MKNQLALQTQFIKTVCELSNFTISGDDISLSQIIEKMQISKTIAEKLADHFDALGYISRDKASDFFSFVLEPDGLEYVKTLELPEILSSISNNYQGPVLNFTNNGSIIGSQFQISDPTSKFSNKNHEVIARILKLLAALATLATIWQVLISLCETYF